MLQYHHYIELLAFGIGVACYKKTWLIHYKILFLLAGLTCLVEILGGILASKYGDNLWLYNIFSPIECLVILYFFSRIIIKKKIKHVIAYSIPMVFISTLVTYLIHPTFTEYNSYARTIYLILWILSCGFFFIDVMINSNTMSLIKQPGFWLATGVLFFSVIFITLISLYQIFSTLPNHKVIFKYFNIVANTFMYVGIAGAFLCQRIATKYYSQSSQQV